ncbi:hypothetical protein KXR87_18685 [Yokenella regensburgei]|uniref:hypothetical protein n=1 Tax=Yokenella regensburgei TaxID=158877 RepID=UPI003F16B82E
MIFKRSVSPEDLILMQTVKELLLEENLTHSELINSIVSKMQVSLNEEHRKTCSSLIRDIWISQAFNAEKESSKGSLSGNNRLVNIKRGAFNPKQ